VIAGEIGVDEVALELVLPEVIQLSSPDHHCSMSPHHQMYDSPVQEANYHILVFQGRHLWLTVKSKLISLRIKNVVLRNMVCHEIV
jgi:hypothetical protein